MKRSPALTPLSHDHHHALFVAKLLRDAAESGEGRDEAVDAFVDFWNREGARHFRVEEEVLLPLSGLPGPSADPDVARMLDEHLAVRRLAAAVLSETAGEVDLAALAETMTAHVRFEERELFPRIEALLDEASLAHLASEIADAG